MSAWIKAIDAELLQLESHLGLTPLSCSKLKIAVGEAHRSLADLNASFTAESSTPDDRFEAGAVYVLEDE